MLSWGNRFNICCFLDSNNYSLAGSRAEAILAADAVETLESPAGNAFGKLRRFHDDKPGWLFGHLSYDLKNETEKLSSQHPDGIGFPDLSFFRPRYLLRLTATTLDISGEGLSEQEAQAIHAELLSQPAIPTAPPLPLVSQARLQRADYLEAVRALQEHIRKGDCYEVNFCREQYAHARLQDPASVFLRLNALSPAPFAALEAMAADPLA